MKKIVFTISDIEYEKFRLEAIHQEKSISDIIRDRVFHTPFHEEVLECYEHWLEKNIQNLMN